jgi:hypothetical protein
MSQAKFWKANTGGSNKRTLIRLFFIFADGHDNSASQQKFNSEWERTKAILTKYRFDWQLMDPSEVSLRKKRCQFGGDVLYDD